MEIIAVIREIDAIRDSVGFNAEGDRLAAPYEQVRDRLLTEEAIILGL